MLHSVAVGSCTTSLQCYLLKDAVLFFVPQFCTSAQSDSNDMSYPGAKMRPAAFKTHREGAGGSLHGRSSPHVPSHSSTAACGISKQAISQALQSSSQVASLQQLQLFISLATAML